MPMMQTDNGAGIHYQIDDFRDPRGKASPSKGWR